MYVAHSKRAIMNAQAYGWLPGTRYKNLFHDPAKDVDLMGEIVRGLLAA